ncbi:MAG: ATP-binding protein [Synergistaceae bacterium]|nr:ATP-binding protein [Synergistaceae bacterium]
MRKVANSNAVTSWFNNEEYMGRRTPAYFEMMDYANTFRDTRLYFGIQRSLNEYSIESGALLSDFFSNKILDPSNPNDHWYFDSIDSPNEFDLDISRMNDNWYLWIKHKVRLDREIVGAFCSALRMPDVAYKMFSGYDTSKVRGYIIDKQGNILMSNSFAEFYGGEIKNRIEEISPAPELVSIINEYSLSRNEAFSTRLEPRIIKLTQGAYGFASFAPIADTKWLAVVFIDSNIFSGAAHIKNLLLLPIALVFAFLIYTEISRVLMQKLVIVPLSCLTQSVSEAKEEEGLDIYGSDRKDEIGALARTIRDMRNTLSSYNFDLRQAAIKRIRQEQLMRTVNNAAVVMLSTTDEDIFESSIMEALDLLGRSVNVNRVHIFQNEMIDGDLHYIHKYEWVSSASRVKNSFPIGKKFSYSENPEWECKFLRGEYINGPLSHLTPLDQSIMAPLGIKSSLVIPLFLQSRFLGFFSFDDCEQERTFTEDETNILRSAGLMMFSAMHRNAQTAKIREAHEHTNLLLDSMPLCSFLLDTNFKVFHCNDEAVKFFNLRNHQECKDYYPDKLVPEYQPDGMLSSKKIKEYVEEMYVKGRSVNEWMHQTLDGTPLPSEVALVRVAYEDSYITAVYVRDLREHKNMMNEIEHQGNLLNTVNRVATILLQSSIEEFENDLWRSMGMMAETVRVNRVYIWKNYTKNDDLCCTQLYEWSEGIEPLKNDEYSDMSYRDHMSDWDEKLSEGHSINGIVRDLSAGAQAYFSLKGALSTLVLPVFLQDMFWGFVGFDDCQNERTFSVNEESILRSASLLIANAMLRNEMTANISATAARMEAVLSNYSGIIWSIDQTDIITLFNGLYLKQLGLVPSSVEGQKFYDAQQKYDYLNIIANVHKTFNEGPQNWTSEIDDKVFRTYTTPILDDTNYPVGVVGSVEDITKEIQLQYELETALKEAQDANSAKSNFLARMSHEMRTPLNAVIGLTELSINAGGLDDEILLNLKKIHNSGKMLLSTVNDILDISKIEAGKLELIPIEYELPSLINDTVTQSIMRKGEKPIKFILDIDENLPHRLCGDELKVKQILNNVLSNAFKYTREGTVELTLRCERENDSVWVTIQIRDTGVGIKAENLDSLFKDYSQLDTRSNRKIEGTGLGLYITKKLAEAMDGSISAESEYSRGSTFTVIIRQYFVSDDTIGTDIANNLKNFNYSDNIRCQKWQLVRMNLPYAHVLVVDDIVTNLDVAVGMMKPYKMHIDCVTSGKEAIDAIRAENVRYNTIFMDHMMPEIDGIEATRIIREEIGTEYAKNIPIIALTANAVIGNEEMFLSRGFQAFLSKPIEINELDEVIQRWVRNKEQDDLLSQQTNADSNRTMDMRSGQDRRSTQDRRCGIDRRAFEGSIPGLDMIKGLERFGDGTSYLEVLRSYAVNTPALIEKTKDVKEDNLAEYVIYVHGIKGSSRGICANFVAAKAEALEKAAKDGDFNFVYINNSSFIEATEKLVKDITKMLSEIAAENPKPIKDKPDKEALIKLLSACENYDIDEIDTVMTEIENCEYDSDDGLAVWLRDNIDMMNYSQIVKKLSNINNSNMEV